MADRPIFAGSKRISPLQIIPAHSTRPRVLWAPGTTGSEITRISIAGNLAGSNRVLFYHGTPLTLQANMGVGAIADNGASPDAVTRTAGDFVADKWVAGERFYVAGATTLANDFTAILASVTQLSMTFATGTAAATEELPALSALHRLTALGWVDVPAGAGRPIVVGVSGLNSDQMPWLDPSPNRLLELGKDDYLLASAETVVGTNEILEVTAQGGDY